MGGGVLVQEEAHHGLDAGVGGRVLAARLAHLAYGMDCM